MFGGERLFLWGYGMLRDSMGTKGTEGTEKEDIKTKKKRSLGVLCHGQTSRVVFWWQFQVMWKNVVSGMFWWQKGALFQVIKKSCFLKIHSSSHFSLTPSSKHLLKEGRWPHISNAQEKSDTRRCRNSPDFPWPPEMKSLPSPKCYGFWCICMISTMNTVERCGEPFWIKTSGRSVNKQPITKPYFLPSKKKNKGHPTAAPVRGWAQCRPSPPRWRPHDLHLECPVVSPSVRLCGAQDLRKIDLPRASKHFLKETPSQNFGTSPKNTEHQNRESCIYGCSVSIAGK